MAEIKVEVVAPAPTCVVTVVLTAAELAAELNNGATWLSHPLSRTIKARIVAAGLAKNGG